MKADFETWLFRATDVVIYLSFIMNSVRIEKLIGAQLVKK
jgi:hypothetical protein